jgi:hypothetical protein
MRERASLTLVALLLLAAIVVTVGAYAVPTPVWAGPASAPVVPVLTTACGTPLPDGAQVVGYGEQSAVLVCPDDPAH